MNLLALIEKCENLSSMNDPAYRPRWISHINDAIREFARKQPWPGLEDLLNVTVTANNPYLVLPPFVDTVVHVFNKSFHIPVDRSGDWDREASAIYSQRTTGRVINYDRLGTVPALGPPVGFCYFVSSHASDVGFNVYVTGRVSNSGASANALASTIKSETIAANGITAVTLANQYTQFISIGKETLTNGDFIFYDAGASNAHMSFIQSYDNDAGFQRIQLLYAPAAADTLEIRYRTKIPPLLQSWQSPPPAVTPDFIIQQALAFHYEEQQQGAKSQAKEQRAARVLQDEVTKDLNFNEPYSQIIPLAHDDDPDTWGDGYWRLT